MGVFIYFYLLFVCIYLLMFYIGGLMVKKFPMSWFARMWRSYICDRDPDDI